MNIEEKKETPVPPPQKTEAKEDDKSKIGPITKGDRPKECVNCGKSIKKKWYYRNGKFYCTNSCWKRSKKKPQEGSEKPAGAPKKPEAKAKPKEIKK